MPRVLFLCTYNIARPQMAEGLLRALGGGGFDVHSAGTAATEVRPEAIQVMQELGIDIRGQISKTLEGYAVWALGFSRAHAHPQETGALLGARHRRARGSRGRIPWDGHGKIC